MKMIDKNKSTPVMKQFWNIKEQYQDCIILFRMGDFYETFDEDAKITSKILNIALTKRSNGAASTVPLAGFPYHALDQYLHKLLKSGYRVAICEQIGDPKATKGIVKREVTEVVSPGAALSDNYLITQILPEGIKPLPEYTQSLENFKWGNFLAINYSEEDFLSDFYEV